MSELTEKYGKILDKLKKGQITDLDWYSARGGNNVGIRIWVDRAGKVYFTDLESGVNYEVEPLENDQDEEHIAELIDKYVMNGYGLEESDKPRHRLLIGNKIKQLREEKGLSQSQLAEMTGLKQQNIARIESGQYSTGQDILVKIATALGKRLDII